MKTIKNHSPVTVHMFDCTVQVLWTVQEMLSWKKKKVEMQNAKNVDVRHAKQTDLINNFINEKKKVLTSF